MQRLEVSGAVRPLYGSLGVKGLKFCDGVCACVRACEEQNILAAYIIPLLS